MLVALEFSGHVPELSWEDMTNRGEAEAHHIESVPLEHVPVSVNTKVRNKKRTTETCKRTSVKQRVADGLGLFGLPMS